MFSAVLASTLLHLAKMGFGNERNAVTVQHNQSLGDCVFMDTKNIAMQPIALNSVGGVPNQIQLLPAGHVVGRDGRQFTNDQPNEIVSHFQVDSGDAVIDYEHSTDFAMGDSAPAAGWIKQMHVRDDGEIWADVEWTSRAANYISNKEYRYISPVLMVREDQANRVVAVIRASLTNAPNLHLKALNKPQNPQPHTEQPAMDKDQRKALCQMLKLNGEASDKSILDAVKTLQDDTKIALNKAEQPDNTKFVPIADYQSVTTQLEEATVELNKQQEADVEAEVDAAIAAGKVAPSSKSYHVAACKADGGLEAFRVLVKSSPKHPAAQSGDTDGQPVTEKTSLNKSELKIAKQLGLDTTDEAVIAEFVAQRRDA